MAMILFVLTLFALLLMITHLQRRLAIAAWIGGLAVCLYLLPDPVKIVAPLVAIMSLGLAESLSSLRPR